MPNGLGVMPDCPLVKATLGYLMSFFDLGNSVTTLELSLREAVFEVWSMFTFETMFRSETFPVTVKSSETKTFPVTVKFEETVAFPVTVKFEETVSSPPTSTFAVVTRPVVTLETSIVCGVTFPSAVVFARVWVVATTSTVPSWSVPPTLRFEEVVTPVVTFVKFTVPVTSEPVG